MLDSHQCWTRLLITPFMTVSPKASFLSVAAKLPNRLCWAPKQTIRILYKINLVNIMFEYPLSSLFHAMFVGYIIIEKLTPLLVQVPLWTLPSNLKGKAQGVFCFPPLPSPLVRRQMSSCSSNVFPAAPDMESTYQNY